MRNATLSIILFSMLSGVVGAQEISEWREENRTGISAETGLLKSWPAGGPTLLWSNLDLCQRITHLFHLEIIKYIQPATAATMTYFMLST